MRKILQDKISMKRYQQDMHHDLRQGERPPEGKSFTNSPSMKTTLVSLYFGL